MDIFELYQIIYDAVDEKIDKGIIRIGAPPKRDSDIGFIIQYYCKKLKRTLNYEELGKTKEFLKIEGLVFYELSYFDDPSLTCSIQICYSHGEKHLEEIIGIFQDFFAVENPNDLVKELEKIKVKVD